MNRVKSYEEIRKYIYAAIIILIVAGFIHYAVRQYTHFGNNFSFTFLISPDGFI